MPFLAMNSHRFSWLVAYAWLLLCLSCQQPEPYQASLVGDRSSVILRAGIAQQPDSKVSLGDDTGTQTSVYWSDDESDYFVLHTPDNQQYRFQKKGTTNQSTTADFELVLEAGQTENFPTGPYKAYYLGKQPGDRKVSDYHHQSGQKGDIKNLFDMEASFVLSDGQSIQEVNLDFKNRSIVLKVHLKDNTLFMHASDVVVEVRGEGLISSHESLLQNTVTIQATTFNEVGEATFYFVLPANEARSVKNWGIYVEAPGLKKQVVYPMKDLQMQVGALYRINKTASSARNEQVYAWYYKGNDTWVIGHAKGLAEAVKWINGTITSTYNLTHTQVLDGSYSGGGNLILLSHDIDLDTRGISLDNNQKPSTSNFTPINDLKHYTFDGQNHVIRGLRVASPVNENSQFLGGLIRQATTVVRNVKLEDAVVYLHSSYNTSYVYAGGLVGYAKAEDATTVPWNNDLNLSSCQLSNDCVVTVANCQLVNFGGVVGMSEHTLAGCHSAATLKAINNKHVYMGGIVGQNKANLLDCRTEGRLESNLNQEAAVAGMCAFMMDKEQFAHNCVTDASFDLYLTAPSDGKKIKVGGLFAQFGSGMSTRHAYLHHCHVLPNTKLTIKEGASYQEEALVSAGLCAEVNCVTMAMCSFRGDASMGAQSLLVAHRSGAAADLRCYSSYGVDGNQTNAALFGFDVSGSTMEACYLHNQSLDITTKQDEMNQAYGLFKNYVNGLTSAEQTLVNQYLNQLHYQWTISNGILNVVETN